MPNYVVQADVVDINSDTPFGTDAFWVDTNVWYWQTYSRASLRSRAPRPYQLADYPAYLQKCVSAGSSIHWIGLSLSELGRLIEDSERELAEMSGNIPSRTNPKSFRHDYPVLRSGVVTEIENAWAAVESVSHPLEILVDKPMVDQALVSFGLSALDAYDQFCLLALQTHGVTQVLTDDGDFCTVPGITLYTSNNNVIQAAAAQQRLVAR
jgi:hypothetical protein